MGALVSRALRPIKMFNIENRAHRVISKEKPVPAPQYPSSLDELKKAVEADPYIDEKLQRKDLELDKRLKNVYVTSAGKPESDVTREQQQDTSRPLPQDRRVVEDYDFGFKEPERIKYGNTTLRHVINFVAAHQASPDEITPAKIALEYKMREEDVANILKYFKTFEVFVPESKNAPATFAGPAQIRKQIEEGNFRQIQDYKEMARLAQEKVSLVKKFKEKTVARDEQNKAPTD